MKRFDIEDHITVIYSDSKYGSSYVIKRPDWDTVSGRSEPYIMDIVRDGTDVPVPKIVYRNPEEPMFVMDYIHGSALPHSENININKLLVLSGKIGSYIGQIHNITFDTVGQLIFDSSDDQNIKPSMDSMNFENYFRTELHNYESQAIANGFNIYLPRLDIPEPVEYVMSPIDFHTANIIVSDDNSNDNSNDISNDNSNDISNDNSNDISNDNIVTSINGVVDFERVYSGHPRWSYEQTLYMLQKNRSDEQCKRIREAFESGYSKHREVPEYNKVFRIACVLREMRAAHIWHDEITEELRNELENKYDKLI